MITAETIPAVDWTLFLSCFMHCYKRVKYLYGGKTPSLGCDSSAFSVVDCSGFVAWILYRATRGLLALNMGSQQMREWFQNLGARNVDYQDAAQGAPGRLFLGVLLPSSDGIGHVFLMSDGVTYESHGHFGVDSRKWDIRVLRNCRHCYEIPIAA